MNIRFAAALWHNSRKSNYQEQACLRAFESCGIKDLADFILIYHKFTPAQKEMTLVWPCSIVGNFSSTWATTLLQAPRMAFGAFGFHDLIFLIFYFGVFIVALWSSLRLTHTSHNAPLLSRDSEIKELATQNGDQGVSCCLLLTGKTFMGRWGSHIYWKWDHQRERGGRREGERDRERGGGGGGEGRW